MTRPSRSDGGLRLEAEQAGVDEAEHDQSSRASENAALPQAEPRSKSSLGPASRGRRSRAVFQVGTKRQRRRSAPAEPRVAASSPLRSPSGWRPPLGPRGPQMPRSCWGRTCTP
eukprot:9504182-Pyramimonas_sp.AAC.2